MALSTRGLKAVMGTSLALLLMAVWPEFGSAPANAVERSTVARKAARTRVRE
jgi:hypothetical protein